MLFIINRSGNASGSVVDRLCLELLVSAYLIDVLMSVKGLRNLPKGYDWIYGR